MSDNAFKVCLNPFELQFLVMVAERRNCAKQPSGVRNQRYDGQNDFSLNLHGVMGEFAVAKMLGTKVDTTVSLAGDDKIADLRVNGKAIQVKTNMARWKRVYLYFNSHDLFRADVAVLCLVKSATEVEVAGWIDKAAFTQEAQSMNFGHGQRVVVEAGQLWPPLTLRTMLDEPPSA